MHFNHGNVLRVQGKLDDAKACYRQALALAPRLAAARYNLAAVLQYQGNLDEAADHYHDVLAQQPDHLETHYNLGLIRHRKHEFDAAIASFQKVLSLLPDHWHAHNALANVLAQTGRLDDAVGSYRKTLALKPDHAEAHNNLGNLLYRLRQSDAALGSYRNAVAIRPDYAAAHNNIANVLAELGQSDAAISSYQRALSYSDAADFRANFARHMAGSDIAAASADLRRLMVRALSEPWARPADLARTAARIIRSDPLIAACVTRASQMWPAPLDNAALFGATGQVAVYQDALLRALIESTHVCDLDLERLLTMTRRILLDAACSEAAMPHDGDALAFHAALARQCFINEYVFACAEDETDRVTALRTSIAGAISGGASVAPLQLLAFATYAPLTDIAGGALLLGNSWPAPVASVLHQQIAQPLEEQRLRKAMPRLTNIDMDSNAVREQYEENPYPRWVKLPTARAALSFDEYLGLQLRSPTTAPDDDAQRRIDVLIAGCGTGQETIETAGLIRGADVLAIDLSLASLSCAQRQTDDAKFLVSPMHRPTSSDSPASNARSMSYRRWACCITLPTRLLHFVCWPTGFDPAATCGWVYIANARATTWSRHVNSLPRTDTPPAQPISGALARRLPIGRRTSRRF